MSMRKLLSLAAVLAAFGVTSMVPLPAEAATGAKSSKPKATQKARKCTTVRAHTRKDGSTVRAHQRCS